MDLNLARTFLDLCRTLHFGRTADNLHLTTSAVSARIRLLEAELNTRLFIRLHNEIELTAAGKRLIPQFRTLLQNWEQVRYLATVESNPAPNLNIAFTPNVWESLDPNWVKTLLAKQPELKIKIDVYTSTEIFDRLHQNKLDLGLTFEPHAGEGIQSQPQAELSLGLFTDRPHTSYQQGLPDDYIHVDWGTPFISQFMSTYADYLNSQLCVSSVRIAIDVLMDLPGAFYMPGALSRKVETYLPIFEVADAPRFRIPIYATHRIGCAKASLISETLTYLHAAWADSEMRDATMPEFQTPQF